MDLQSAPKERTRHQEGPSLFGEVWVPCPHCEEDDDRCEECDGNHGWWNEAKAVTA